MGWQPPKAVGYWLLTTQDYDAPELIGLGEFLGRSVTLSAVEVGGSPILRPTAHREVGAELIISIGPRVAGLVEGAGVGDYAVCEVDPETGTGPDCVFAWHGVTIRAWYLAERCPDCQGHRRPRLMAVQS